jgi:hypothetical protein
MAKGAQCTVVWYVDDLKISHEDLDVVGEHIGLVQQEFGARWICQSVEEKFITTWGSKLILLKSKKSR